MLTSIRRCSPMYNRWRYVTLCISRGWQRTLLSIYLIRNAYRLPFIKYASARARDQLACARGWTRSQKYDTTKKKRTGRKIYFTVPRRNSRWIFHVRPGSWEINSCLRCPRVSSHVSFLHLPFYRWFFIHRVGPHARTCGICIFRLPQEKFLVV